MLRATPNLYVFRPVDAVEVRIMGSGNDDYRCALGAFAVMAGDTNLAA